jgi:hypothetical protein
MTARRRRRGVDRARFTDYRAVAEQFHAAARDSIALEYWTAAGLLIVHAAIAYGDAVAIRESGQKSAGDNHEDAVVLLADVIRPGHDRTQALNHLRRIIEEKNKVSYLGETYTASQARFLMQHLNRFADWADSILAA